MFNWHRSYDDGIWLYDGTEDIDFVRRLQKHPWIVDPFFDSQESDPVEEPKIESFSAENIMRWDDEVEKYRQLGESVIP